METVSLYFFGLQNHCGWWLQPGNSKIPAPWKKSFDQPRQHIKKQRHYSANKGQSSQDYGFSSNHVWMLKLECKEIWVPKNWWLWTMVLEKTLESAVDCKEIQPVHPKGNQSEYSLVGLMLKLWLQYFGHLMQRSNSFEKTLMLGKTEGMRKGDGRGWWYGWMASPTQWTWVWVNFGNWRWTGRPGALQYMGSQSIRHNWGTELNWLVEKIKFFLMDLITASCSTVLLSYALHLCSIWYLGCFIFSPPCLCLHTKLLSLVCSSVFLDLE